MRLALFGGIAALALACTPVLASEMAGNTGMNSMRMPKCAANNPAVWVNTASNTYFMKGEKYYGKTRAGTFVCRSSAIAMHAHHAMMNGRHHTMKCDQMMDSGMMKSRSMKSGMMKSGSTKSGSMSGGSMGSGSMNHGSMMTPGSMSSPGAMSSMSPGAPKPFPTGAAAPNAGGSAPPVLPNNPASSPAPKPSAT